MAFKDLKPLATKVVNALAVSRAISLEIADAKTIDRKIQGAKANDGSKTPTTQPTIICLQTYAISRQDRNLTIQTNPATPPP